MTKLIIYTEHVKQQLSGFHRVIGQLSLRPLVRHNRLNVGTID